MSTTANKKVIMKWVHIIIVLGLMFGVGFLSPVGKITPLGMKVLGVFLGMMWGWIFCGLVWPSIFGLVVLALTGFNSVMGVFGSFFGTITIQVLFCFMISGLLNAFGVTDYIAGKLMSAKFIIGHPWKMAIMIFLSVAAISILVDVIPAIFLMWTIFEKAAETVGCGKEEKFYAFIVSGIVVCSALAGMILPFKVTTVSYLGFVAAAYPITLNALPYILFATVFLLLIMATYFFLAKYVLRVDVSKFETDADTFANLRGMKATKKQKIGLAFIAGFIGMLMWPSIFPKTWAITQVFSKLGLVGVIVVLITLAFFLNDEDGNPMITVGNITRGIGWDMIFLIGSTFPLAEAIRSADCGIMATINAVVRPLAMDLGPTTLVIISVILLGGLTQVSHNGVLAAMFMPFLVPLFAEMGGNPVAYWLVVYFALNVAFFTPAASAYSGFIFGHECFAKKPTYAYFFGGAAYVVSCIILIVAFPILTAIM